MISSFPNVCTRNRNGDDVDSSHDHSHTYNRQNEGMLAQEQSLKSLRTLPAKKTRWILLAFCVLAVVWLLLAIHLIIFNIQRPLGFIFVGLAVLCLLLGLYPWHQEAWYLGTRRRSKKHNASTLEPQSTTNKSWVGKSFSTPPENPRVLPAGQPLARSHRRPMQDQKEYKISELELRRSGPKPSYDSGILSSRLNNPLPPTPAERLIGGGITQSSASVRPRFEASNDRHHVPSSSHSSRRSAPPRTQLVSYSLYPHDYTELEMAVDSAYYPMTNGGQDPVDEARPGLASRRQEAHYV